MRNSFLTPNPEAERTAHSRYSQKRFEKQFVFSGHGTVRAEVGQFFMLQKSAALSSSFRDSRNANAAAATLTMLSAQSQLVATRNLTGEDSRNTSSERLPRPIPT